MSARLLAPLLLLLISCAPSPASKYAKIEYIRPANAPPYHHVSLELFTGKWGCSAHGFGPYREIEWLSIRLPEKPVKRGRYEAAQVTVLVSSGERIVLTGGYIEVDPVGGQVEINFQSPTGPYWANGVYPAGPVFAPNSALHRSARKRASGELVR